MADRLYLATDRAGIERTDTGARQWAVPTGDADPPSGPQMPTPTVDPDDPGNPPAPSVGAVQGLSADRLLDHLDERIFLLEPAGSEGLVLVAETSWSPIVAARFALDCLDHAFDNQLDLELPRGTTLGAVLTEARDALEHAGREEQGAFAFVRRLARLRHLRRTRELVGTTTFGLAKEDERDDLDLLDDPAWATLAALGEGLLAASEALRLAVAPRYAHATEDEGRGLSEADEPRFGMLDLQTPWGPLTVGAEKLPAHEPAARSAGEAAERARQAVTDRDGAEAGAVERTWQAVRLESLLG